ncbi:MAG: class I SAM-dependent methyltransferase [Candidatus Methylacidiphilales bacterium]|nr:class I SAM-dependent methyltransferase [Candidatus Methylacidiphilales bacterium]
MDRRYWEEKGRAYDAEIFDVYAEDRKGVVAAAIRRTLRKSDRAADLGCGTGKALPLLAPRALSVEAVDLSESCLRKARHFADAWKNITFRRADLARERVSGRLDFVLNVNVLIMPDAGVRQAILRHIAVRLKRGGRLLLVVPSLESSLWVARRLYDWELKDGRTPAQARRGVQRLLGDRFRVGLADGLVPIDGVPTKHFLAPELSSVLAAVGLELRGLEKVEYAWRTEFEDPPSWMRAPYPWDWLVRAVRV